MTTEAISFVSKPQCVVNKFSRGLVLLTHRRHRPFKMLGTGPLLGQALQNAWDRPALGTAPSKCLGQALLNASDRPALGTGPSKCLGQARSWDRPFKMRGTGPCKCLGAERSFLLAGFVEKPAGTVVL